MSKTYISVIGVIAFMLIVGGITLAVRSSKNFTSAGDQFRDVSSQATEQASSVTSPAASADSSTQDVTIRYSSNGFSPSEVTVPVGTTVMFVNDGNSAMWPASDPHPVHTAYGEFDSNRSLRKGETYSFTFTKKGNWGFHNHMMSSHTGMVTVK